MEDDVFLKEYIELTKNLFEILEVELEELTEQEKHLLIAYSFGMISAMAEENQISLDTKYFAVENVIMEVFQYSKQISTDIRKKLVDSTQKGGSEAFMIMIHQGKYIYPKYKDGNYNEVYDRLTNLIDVIVTEEYKNY
ncbi:Imm48 family immunity protein [Clostridium sp.]|uniref:Imm48 family immunity protein n=1 Tax=Clostridium sp. TaxID=1506 RepID=UPI002636B6AF|nr:Imm48 family immunity protein [Clostridium sp.]